MFLVSNGVFRSQNNALQTCGHVTKKEEGHILLRGVQTVAARKTSFENKTVYLRGRVR